MIWFGVAGLLVAWTAGQLLGWWRYCHRKHGGPLNWRIVLGPWLYHRWWEETEDWWPA